jgi:hypothetical protein
MQTKSKSRQLVEKLKWLIDFEREVKNTNLKNYIQKKGKV